MKVFFDILGDADLDGEYDRDFAFYLSRPTRPWFCDPAKKAFLPLPELRSAWNEVFEIAIPLTGFTQRSFRIIPIIHDQNAKQSIDEWPTWSWIQVDVP